MEHKRRKGVDANFTARLCCRKAFWADHGGGRKRSLTTRAEFDLIRHNQNERFPMRQQIFPSAGHGTKALALAVLVLVLGACGVSSRAADTLTGDVLPAEGGDLIIHPVNHATFVMGWNDKVIYVDRLAAANGSTDCPGPA